MGREFQSLAVQGKKTVEIDTLATSRNGDRKVMQSIRTTSRPSSRTSSAGSGEHLPN